MNISAYVANTGNVTCLCTVGMKSLSNTVKVCIIRTMTDCVHDSTVGLRPR